MFKIGSFKKRQDSALNNIEEICLSTWESLYRYIYYKVQNREEAEDITQETYIKALSYIQKKGTNPDSYIAFFKTVALNIIRDRWRKNKRYGPRVNLELINPSKTAVDDPAENSTQRMLIENALKDLTDEQRRVVELRIISGFSVAETANKMEKTEGAIRVLQYRALKKLAQIIEKDN
ncbi:RNA polymerase sigma factor [Sporosalibacterium faouarense]|uniref:RNA polymerase sigma factor n=1 Tax=Sporosalibacterium faouarense TaxID=516123 RepID=UPI00192AF4FE|nr:RNA polymerase sigma factor [Sporosalibacterium faouarense]